jgi:hypothetical protein
MKFFLKRQRKNELKTKRDYENYENIWKKKILKHRTGQWKFEASMKNVKKFEVSEKSLESLETGDSLFCEKALG